jgi:hypothetical protein
VRGVRVRCGWHGRALVILIASAGQVLSVVARGPLASSSRLQMAVVGLPLLHVGPVLHVGHAQRQPRRVLLQTSENTLAVVHRIGHCSACGCERALLVMLVALLHVGQPVFAWTCGPTANFVDPSWESVWRWFRIHPVRSVKGLLSFPTPGGRTRCEGVTRPPLRSSGGILFMRLLLHVSPAMAHSRLTPAQGARAH